MPDDLRRADLHEALATIEASASALAAGLAPGDPREEDVARIRAAAQRGAALAGPRRTAAANGHRPALSPRELEVLERIALGLSVARIGADLRLSPSTVKTHVEHLYRKLGVSERAAAVAEAMRRGLLS